MSKTINKKYFFLQNLFYQSIPIQSFAYQKNLSLERTNKTVNSSKINKTKLRSKFVGIDSYLPQLNSLNQKGLYVPTLWPSQRVSGQTFVPVPRNKVLSYVHRNQNKLKFGSASFANKLLLHKKSISDDQTFLNLSFHRFLKNPSKLISRSVTHQFNFPYKKSFFCYWLLPFLGFVSCFPILKDPYILKNGYVAKLTFSPQIAEINKKETKAFTSISYLTKKPLSNQTDSNVGFPTNWETKIDSGIKTLSYFYVQNLKQSLQENLESIELSPNKNLLNESGKLSGTIKPHKFTKNERTKIRTCMVWSNQFKQKNDLLFWQISNPGSTNNLVFDSYFSSILLNSSFQSYLDKSNLRSVKPTLFVKDKTIGHWVLLNKKNSTNKMFFFSKSEGFICPEVTKKFAKKLEKDSFLILDRLSRNSSNKFDSSIDSKLNLSFFLEFPWTTEKLKKNLQFTTLKQRSFKNPLFAFQKASKLFNSFVGSYSSNSTTRLLRIPLLTNSISLNRENCLGNQQNQFNRFDIESKVQNSGIRLSALSSLLSYPEISTFLITNKFNSQKSFKDESTSFLENEIVSLICSENFMTNELIKNGELSLEPFPLNHFKTLNLKKLKNLLKSVKEKGFKNSKKNLSNIEMVSAPSILSKKLKKESLYSLVFQSFLSGAKEKNSSVLPSDRSKDSFYSLDSQSTSMTNRFQFLDKTFLIGISETSIGQFHLHKKTNAEISLKTTPIWISNYNPQVPLNSVVLKSSSQHLGVNEKSFRETQKKDFNESNFVLKKSFVLGAIPSISNLNSLGFYNHWKRSFEINPFVGEKKKMSHFSQYSDNRQNEIKRDFSKNHYQLQVNSNNKYFNFLSTKIKIFWFKNNFEKWGATINSQTAKKRFHDLSVRSTLRKEVNKKFKNHLAKQNRSLATQLNLWKSSQVMIEKDRVLSNVSSTGFFNVKPLFNLKPLATPKKFFPTFSKLEKICNSYFSIKYVQPSLQKFSNPKPALLSNLIAIKKKIAEPIAPQTGKILIQNTGFGYFQGDFYTSRNSRKEIVTFSEKDFKDKGISNGAKEKKKKFKKIKVKSRFSTENEKNNFSLSPNLLLHNRIFIIKSKNQGKSLKKDGDLLKYESFLTKKKYNQRKNRKKKEKNDSRIKKRERSYPRPLWLRSQMYKKFMTSRYPVIKIQGSNLLKKKGFSLAKDNSFFFSSPPFSTAISLEASKAKDQKNHWPLSRPKIYRNYQENSLWTSGIIKSGQIVFSYANGTIENNIELYQISRRTLGELRKDSWKSYWLRSNLNSYIKRLELSLKSLKEQMKKNGINGQINTGLNCSKREMNNFEPKEKNLEIFVNLHLTNGRNPFLLTGNKWQILTNLKEYERIIYQRMQQTISNIRENVGFDGEARARASTVRNQKLITVKPIKDFWIKLGKTLTFELPNCSPIPFYGDISRLRILWTLNHSNLSQSTLFNHRKELWQAQKQKTEASSNKTQKILYKMICVAKNSLTECNQSPFSSFQFIQKPVELEFISKLRKKPFFNKFVITSFQTNEKKTTKSVEMSYNGFSINELFMGESKKNYEEFFKKSFSIGQSKLRKKEQKLAYLGFLNKKTSQLKINTTKYNGISGTSEFKRQDAFKIGKFTPTQSDSWWNLFSINEIRQWHNPIKNEKTKMVQIYPNLYSSLFLNDDLKEMGRWVSPFLFHFCAVLFFLNVSEIRGFLKWNFIWFSTLFKIYFKIAINISSLFISTIKSQNLINFNETKDAIMIPKISGLRKSYLNHIQTYRFLWLKSKDKIRASLLEPTNEKKFAIKSNETLKREKIGEILISPPSINITRTSLKASNGFQSFFQLTTKWLYFSFLNLLTKNFLASHLQKDNFKEISKEQSSFDVDLKSPSISRNSNSLALSKTDEKVLKEKEQVPFLEQLPGAVSKRLTEQKKKELITKSQRLAMFQALGENRWMLLKKQSPLKGAKRRYFERMILRYQISAFANIYFSITVWLLRRFDTFQALLGGIYFFFEKPGELLGEVLAYAFLVEWSSDFLGTIPQSEHLDRIRIINSSARGVRPFFMGYPLIFQPFNKSDISISTPFSKAEGFIFPEGTKSFASLTLWTSSAFLFNRRVLDMYETILHKWFQPDNDLILRQKKGRIFWDLWSQVFIDVADDANINILELTSLKEEQNRLFDKLEGLEDIETSKNVPMVKRDLKPFELIGNKSGEFSLATLKSFNKRNLKSLKSVQPIDPHQHWKYWSIHQSFGYQGKDTDLFIQKSPPKSFSQIPSIKYSKSAPAPIGKIVCQIFSGIFYEKVTRNILVVGGNNGQSPFIIQAIAGETEFKIIQDNAQRYTMVQNGVAIGIKLLKDVFEALSSHTPCLFLLEDIHHIGGRRPLLFSDQTAIPAGDSGYEKQAPLDEKNQVTYQLSKHIVNHYKKPYKGDLSLLIPTNHFSLNLFSAGSSAQIRTSLGSTNHFGNLKTEKQASSPLDKTNLERWLELNSKNSTNQNLSSSFQIESNQLLAPPATSPFSVLLLKENQKLKAQQIVKEMPWGGIPAEKLALLSKFNYSIRVKIAILTDRVLSNISIQLDMITDLLVIIDGVKGDRGFLVFATTHIPYNLDPALRRPGRFDETISLPLIPNLLNRWDIFKIQATHEKPSCYSFFSKGRTVDFSKIYGLFPSNHGMIDLMDKANNLKTHFNLANHLENQNLSSQKYFTLTSATFTNSQKNNVAFINPSFPFKGNEKLKDPIWTNLMTRPYFYGSQAVLSFFSQMDKVKELRSQHSKKLGLSTKSAHALNPFLMPSNDVFLLNSQIYLSMFVSPQTIKSFTTHLIAGKLGELFSSSTLTYKSISKIQNKTIELENSGFLMVGEAQNLFGIEKIWKAATSLLFSILTKRYVYNQNLIIPKLFHFSNYSSLHQSPIPPASTIFLPVKRQENYRRTFYTQQIQKKANFEGKTLQEVWEFHQQQRFVKRLYKLPLREFFRSEVIKNKFTGFSNSLITLSSVEKNMNFSTNSNYYYRNRILNRHQNYLKNQWWNGQLYEHNLELTFLSAIDWRYTFVNSMEDISIDFPDSDQFYNVQNRRWMVTSNSWKNWLSFEKTNNAEAMNQYIFDCMICAFNSLDQSREILDFYAFNSLNECILKDLKEITILSLWKRFYQTKN